MKIHHKLPSLDADTLALVTGGTHYYKDEASANRMAARLEKWNPDSIYDTRQAKNGQYYVTTGRKRPPAHTHHYDE
jgi:hypothetical protein